MLQGVLLRLRCEICGKDTSHNPHCPYYIPKKSTHYCSICGEGIYNGEEYVKNDNNEYSHYDCFYGTRNLLEWLGYRIEIMEEIDIDETDN